MDQGTEGHLGFLGHAEVLLKLLAGGADKLFGEDDSFLRSRGLGSLLVKVFSGTFDRIGLLLCHEVVDEDRLNSVLESFFELLDRDGCDLFPLFLSYDFVQSFLFDLELVPLDNFKEVILSDERCGDFPHLVKAFRLEYLEIWLGVLGIEGVKSYHT